MKLPLPPNLKFAGILEQGHGFKAKLEEHPSDYPRYYFVLNFKPKADNILILLTSTTQFEEHRDCIGGDDVHIPLSKEDYQELTNKCLICCNRPLKLKKRDVQKQLRKQNYKLLRPLPEAVLDKLLVGVANSPVVEEYIKEIVLGSVE